MESKKEKTLAEKKSTSVYEQVKDAEKDRKTATDKIKKKGRSFIGGIIYYGMPLFSLAVFGGILGFGTVPSIKSILNQVDEIEEKEEKIQDLDSEIGQLEELESQEAQIISDLEIIESIVPSDRTQVAKFVKEIEDLADKHGLQEAKTASSENIEKLEEEVEEEIQQDTAAIIHIPTSSEYVAEFEDIEDYLNALYEKDDFIIVSSLEMNGHMARQILSERQREQGERVTINTDLGIETWSMSVTFEKYQFSKGFDDFILEDLVSIKSRPNEETLEFIRDKYGS